MTAGHVRRIPFLTFVTGLVLGVAPGTAEQAEILAIAAREGGSVIMFDPHPLRTQSDEGNLSGPVTVGYDHACGLTDDGEALCWGRNRFGQIGSRGPSAVTSPTSASESWRFEFVSAGRFLTCGLSGGQAVCWGSNRFGGLGQGDFVEVAGPVAVEGEMRFVSVSVGEEHACGLADTGQAYCWGNNHYSRLGEGTEQNRNSPTAVLGEHSFSTLSTGYQHACALTHDGATYCWGADYAGQIGHGERVVRDTPTEPSPRIVAGDQRFVSLSAGYNATCALTEDGSAFCWGVNHAGTLGDGTNELRLRPTPVGGGLRFRSLSVGHFHACGIGTDGTTYCWGANDRGQIGDGSRTHRNLPVAVETADEVFEFVEAGGYRTCGVTSDGAAFCWGRNPTEGSLWETGSDQLRPTRVPTAASFARPPWR